MDNKEKWIMFKNFMHNELGITKEDIRQWIEEAVEVQAKALSENTFKQFSVEKILKEQMQGTWGSAVKKEIREEVAETLVKCLSISFTPPPSKEEK